MTNADLWIATIAHIVCWASAILLIFFCDHDVMKNTPERTKFMAYAGVYMLIAAGVVGLVYLIHSEGVREVAIVFMSVSIGLAFFMSGIVAVLLDDLG